MWSLKQQMLDDPASYVCQGVDEPDVASYFVDFYGCSVRAFDPHLAIIVSSHARIEPFYICSTVYCPHLDEIV